MERYYGNKTVEGDIRGIKQQKDKHGFH